jgi:hypothetical protein
MNGGFMRKLTAVALFTFFSISCSDMDLPTGHSKVGHSSRNLASESDLGVMLGGLDLDAYCQSSGFVKSVLVKDSVIFGPGNSRGNWACSDSAGYTRMINMRDACTWQYKREIWKAEPLDVNDAYSWRCFVR